jgi:thiosulfate/3-mercaptopyruvate sulfurtransferase
MCNSQPAQAIQFVRLKEEWIMKTQALVTTQWVADNLENPAIRLAEVSVETSLYDTEHLPGAVNFSWTTQLQDAVQRDIISQENFEQLLGRSGITPETHVILYGDNNNWFAAYGFWIFKYYGHESVSLMDGGLKKWKLENRELTSAVPRYEPAGYRVSKVNREYRADRDFIRTRLGNKGFRMVDVRSPAEYNGEIIAPPGMTETAQRAGHIPGAANVPWSQAVAEDGTYKPKAELEKLYGDKGVHGNGDEIVTYCRIGERSSHTWVVLKYILGYDNVRNYDGSWTEWGNLIGNPIKKGAEA